MPVDARAGLTLGRFVALLSISTGCALLAMLAALCVGSSTSVGWPDGTLFAGTLGTRVERVLLAGIVGLALGMAGAAYQSVLRNELADPYLLGIASGASLCAYLWRLPSVAMALASFNSVFAVASQQTLTFAGAMGAAGLVLLLAGARGRVEPAKLVLTGVIVSTLCGALTLLIFTLVKSMPGSGYVQSVFVGELQTSLSRAQLWAAGGVVGVGSLVLLMRSPRLNVLALSDDEAQLLGLKPARERMITLAVASLVTAGGVSVSGPIGFVGLIAPHVARRLVGPDARVQLPAAGAGGVVLLVLADAMLRYLAGVRIVNTVVPIGVATALLGGPFFLMLLLRERRDAR
jgi:iron complex transport system permease protein